MFYKENYNLYIGKFIFYWKNEKIWMWQRKSGSFTHLEWSIQLGYSRAVKQINNTTLLSDNRNHIEKLISSAPIKTL